MKAWQKLAGLPVQLASVLQPKLANKQAFRYLRF
jgi:hypothetical protein